MLRTRETLVINENMDADDGEVRQLHASRHRRRRNRRVFVPLVAGDQARGLINLVDMEREHAFSASDVRLLQTLANAMSVALENARLFDETQRLFKESEQRAAELAIINSVQQALAAELNMQGIYDAVGDKIREIFNQADVGIRIYDPQTDLIHFPVCLRETESGSPSSPNRSATTGVDRARAAHARDAGHQRKHGAGNREVWKHRPARHADGEIGGLRAADRGRPGARADQPRST